MGPVIKEGNRRTLTEADMPGLAKRDQAVHVQGLVEVRQQHKKKGGRKRGGKLRAMGVGRLVEE
jgi:hypothetical protein